jgi:Fic family protein
MREKGNLTTMKRSTGTYRVTQVGGEQVRAFLPYPLPPAQPPLLLNESLQSLLAEASSALAQLSIAGKMVPSAEWFLYGFVRKEAVISSQIEGTQATLRDVLTFEATQKTDRPEDVREICNYLAALAYARREIARPQGLPLSMRLLCAAHKRLMRGVRGVDQQPGQVRTSQNWIGGTRPGNARFVPPPAEDVPPALAALDQWIHAPDSLPPLVRAGLAHVQFETIHPFLDGNGRIGRLLVALLVEHWGLLGSPLLYLSLALKRHREEYYTRLSAVRTDGDWEGWIAFFLDCVREAAQDGVDTAGKIFSLHTKDRRRLLSQAGVTIPAIRLLEQLPSHPILTLPYAMEILKTTKPTAAKAIESLRKAKVLGETTGKQRDRVYAYQDYLALLTDDTE